MSHQVACPCGWDGPSVNLRYHYRQSPQCRPAEEPPTSERDRTSAFNVFAVRLQAFFDTELWTAHTSHFVSVPHAEVSRTMMISIVCFVVSFILAELRAEVAITGGLTISTVVELGERIIRIFQLLPTARKLIEARKNSLLQATPICRGVGDEEKLGVSFSIVQLLSIVFNESKAIRQHSWASSNLWKSGKLYQKVPENYVDSTCGSCFRNSATCKKATPEELDDFRVELVLWNDAFTSVDGNGTKAKFNKYEVVLAALLNLPLYMRFYFDHLLLLALYQHQWGASHGGIAGMLAGVDDQGVESNASRDVLNLRAEIKASQERKIKIKLPNDDDPSNPEPIERTLILHVLLISLDWLANGAFGPFAESVSANRPCFKCLWTHKCGCAWIARSDARMDTIVHSATCKRRRVRTHDETMSTVQEMRLLGAAELKAAQTEHGIFSTVFASEYLLDDVVKGPTIDTMHIFGSSGLIPYHASWLLDIYIPAEFSWNDLNAKIAQRNRLKLGPHLPKLARSGKTPRLSAKLTLTASESIAFARASPHLFEDLVTDKTTAHWLSWMKLVRLVRFVTRRTFVAQVDPPKAQQLYDEFMRSVEHVPQWTGCQKPKHHLPDHLSESLQEQGPWRAYWCFWGEAFIQYLKHLFEMGNYKSAPHSVSVLWAALAVEHYRDPRRVAWHEEAVTPADVDGAFKSLADLTPPITAMMMSACASEGVLAARHLSSFTCARETISTGAWVMASMAGVTVVGSISEMLHMQVSRDEHIVSIVRLMLVHVVEPVFDNDDTVTLRTPLGTQGMCIALESAHVTLLSCEHGHGRLSLWV